MPSEIWLVATDNAYAFQRHGKETVAIGMPLLVMMNKQELQAVICHELAHHLKGDTHVMPNAKRLELLLERALLSVRGRTGLILMGPYRLFYHFFCRHIYAVFQRHEYVADRQAAQVMGTDAMAGGLVKLSVYAERWQHFCCSWLSTMAEAGIYPLLTSHFRSYFSLFEREVELSSVPCEHTRMDSTHPTSFDRITALQDKPQPSLGLPDPDFGFSDIEFSQFFWNQHYGTSGVELPLSQDPRLSLQRCYEVIFDKYGAIFNELSYQDCNHILYHWGPITRPLYVIDQRDHYESERERVIQVLCACVFKRVACYPWRVGPCFAPVFEVDSESCDIEAAVRSLFDFDAAAWKRCLTLLQIDPEEMIVRIPTGIPLS